MHPAITDKEEPAIIEHLTEVYDEVLSIAPTSISLVYEEDLVIEEFAADPNGDVGGGVIRKSAFRVIGEFLSSICSDLVLFIKSCAYSHTTFLSFNSS